MSDGKKLHGQFEGLTDQVVVTRSPAKITVPAFYSIQAIGRFLQPDGAGHSVQLDLLCADEPLKEVRAMKAKLLKPGEVGPRSYFRVNFASEEGNLVLWIDQETWLLFRIDFPTEGLKDELPPNTEMEMTAEFRRAEIDAPIEDSVFTWKGSKDEVPVRYLVSPPNPQFAPHPQLGRTLSDLTLMTPDGTKQDLKDLEGKVTVIDFWATWCGYCIQGMPKFDKASKSFAENEDVRFIAISLDNSNVSDDQVAARLKQAGSDVPWARVTAADPLQKTLDACQLDGIPAYVVLGKDGLVQFLHQGADLKADEKLPEIVNSLLNDGNPAAEARRLWEQLQKDYAQEIQLARADGTNGDYEIHRSEIAERQEPTKFQLDRLWKNADLKTPGNLLPIANADGDLRILAVAGADRIVELDAKGAVTANHDQLVPQNAAISFLRLASGKDGQKYFVAGSAGLPRFFVFDDQWKQKLEYPEADTAQVFDVMPVDLDADGSSELCVGYFNDAGLHAVNLEGRRLWRNRSVHNVGSLALVGTDKAGKPTLLCAHSFGALSLIDGDGETLSSITVANRAVTNVAVRDLDDNDPREIAALSIDESGRRSLIGISLEGEILWQYLLPFGEHQNPVEMLTSGRLIADSPGYWLVATADGTVHIISADGQETDHFSTGETLSGVAVARDGDQILLLISSDQGVTAYTVSKTN